MVGGRVQHPLERPEGRDRARVDPELVERVHRAHRDEHLEGEAEHGERPVEHLRRDALHPPLTKRRREVVLLALVMNDVAGPDDVHAVARAVKKVVRTVDREEEHHPRDHRRRRHFVDARVLEERHVHPERDELHQRRERLLADSAREARDRVGEAIAVESPLSARDEQLDGDREKEERDRERDVFRVQASAPGGPARAVYG